MHGARPGPDADEPCGGRPEPHGKDHLPRGVAGAEGLRHPGPCAALRGSRARAAGQRRTAAPRAGRAADRKERGRPRAEGRRVPRGRLSGGAAAHGEIHRGQYADLRHLSQVRLSRGYPHLRHRRGADGRHRLSGDLPHDRPRAGEDHDPRRAAHDGHHGDGGHRQQPLSLQGGHGHDGQARSAGRERRAHRAARRAELPRAALGAPSADGLLARGPRLCEKAGGARAVYDGRRRALLHREAERVL